LKAVIGEYEGGKVEVGDALGGEIVGNG